MVTWLNFVSTAFWHPIAGPPPPSANKDIVPRKEYPAWGAHGPKGRSCYRPQPSIANGNNGWFSVPVAMTPAISLPRQGTIVETIAPGDRPDKRSRSVQFRRELDRRFGWPIVWRHLFGFFDQWVVQGLGVYSSSFVWWVCCLLVCRKPRCSGVIENLEFFVRRPLFNVHQVGRLESSPVRA